MPAPPARSPVGWLLFGAASLLGWGLAFFFFIGLMLGECLPRDESAQMHACDAAKAFDFTAYPLAALACYAVAVGLQLWGWRPSWIPALTFGLPALAMLMLAEKVWL